MQITIPEIEIKAAIQDYIKRQVNIREDQLIDIDLKATRGAEGYQAIITITSPEHVEALASASKPVEVPPAPKADAPLKIVEKVEAAKADKADDKPVKAKAKLFNTPASEIQTEEVPMDTPEVAADEALDPAYAPDTAPAVEAATAGTTEDAPKRSSIFGGLTKPVNTKADEAA